MFWRFTLLILSYIPLAAHFMRYGENEIAIAIALFPLLALFRKKITNLLMQLGLLAGVALVWVPTTLEITQQRMALGEPWLKMVIIMGAVMIFSLICGWCAKGIPAKTKNRLGGLTLHRTFIPLSSRCHRQAVSNKIDSRPLVWGVGVGSNPELRESH